MAGPRGGEWTASLLLGGAGRETGMLRDRLYIGERVWNRQHFVKDPSTGRRVARPNPREAWVVSQVPDLAILDLGLWEAVQRRLEVSRRLVTAESATNTGAALAAARRPHWPLAGLVRCGLCNGPMSVVGTLRGDLAAFLRMAEADRGSGATNGKATALRVQSGRSRSGGEVLGTLDAGTGFGLCRTRLQHA